MSDFICKDCNRTFETCICFEQSRAQIEKSLGGRENPKAMTPKQQVLHRLPNSYCAKVGPKIWVIMPVKELGRICIGKGTTPHRAWRAAAKAVKRRVEQRP